MNDIQKCIANIDRCTASLKAAAERLHEFRLGAWLRSEQRMLKRWKRKPHGFHGLPNCEVAVVGQVHTMRTTYLRRDYNMADAVYLERCAASSYLITAEHADIILRKLKPSTSHAKRRPAEADPDPDMRAEYKARPERRMSAEDLAREHFTGRALERELRRIK